MGTVRHPTTLFGLRIYESPFLVERVLHARSPARARRRERLGHSQNYIEKPFAVHMRGVGIVMHPTLMQQLRRMADDCAPFSAKDFAAALATNSPAPASTKPWFKSSLLNVARDPLFDFKSTRWMT